MVRALAHNHSLQSPLRFSRWSRRSYSVFVSIGRCVTISALRFDVADSLFAKDSAEEALSLPLQSLEPSDDGSPPQESNPIDASASTPSTACDQEPKGIPYIYRITWSITSLVTDGRVGYALF